MVDAVRASIMKYEQQRGLRPWSPIPTCMPHQKLCEVCESAVVTVICEADAASLCTTCDTDIHSVNPLARRHLRVPIHQYQANKYFVEVTMTHGQNHHYQSENNTIHEDDYGDDEKEASSWILPEPAGKNLSSEAESESLLFRESEVDEYLDLVGYGDRQPYIDSKTQVQSYYTETDGADSVVPVQGLEMKLDRQNSGHQYLDLEFDNQKVGCYSSSTLEHSMVLLDREARVLRYREKRKNRKFEKTIRYASRKAYAETRPRIKGRFAKRTDREVEVDQICPAAFMMEASYGVVPTF